MPVSQEKIQLLSEQQVKLTELTHQPGWGILKSILATKRALFERNFMARNLSAVPTAEPLNQREVDYWRGFFACADYIIAAPEKAESTLESALKGANLLKG